MTENTAPVEGVVVDPLAQAAAEVDTRFPRLVPDRIYRMIIRSPEKKTNDKGTEMMNLKLETTTPTLDTDGKELHPGFKFTTRIIGASGDRDMVAVAKDLAMFVKAVYGTKSPEATSTTFLRELWANPSVCEGKVVDVKVGIQKEKDGFPESNTVKSWVIPA